LFIAVWVAVGFFRHLDPNSYLLLGIPLTIFFQVAVKREPLTALWLRAAPPIVNRKAFIAAIVVLAPLPAYSLFEAILKHAAAPILLWLVACLAGVVAAAYSVAAFNRIAWTATLRCLATGGVISIMMILLVSIVGHKTWAASSFLTFGRWLLLYFPVSFVMEEVSFRGAIDSYVQQPGDRQWWATPFLVSVLWGLWHLPIVPHATIGTAITLIVVHTLLGVPLSIAWRQSGNLAAPAGVHAFVDAVRNMVQSM
jgi:membrane protease YdiL (CAAX protease family)